MGEMRCPITGRSSSSVSGMGKINNNWWPNQLNLNILHQNSELSTPMGCKFNYAEEFEKLDYYGVKKDLYDLMTDSKDW